MVRPRLASWLLRLLVREPVREFLEGDLDERFAALASRHPARARRWYWRQVLQAVWHLRSVPARRVIDSSNRTGDSIMRQLAADSRFAVRQLARQPFYAAVAATSLAIAIGANGLVFGLVDNLVLNPFQFPEADRLVSVGSAFPKLNVDEGFIEQHSPAEIDDFRRASTLNRLAAFDLGNRAVSNGTTTERVFTVLALDDPLPVLGVPPALGRGFSAEELGPGGPRVAVISDRLWATLFASDPDIIGRAIQVNSEPRTVVGVAAGSTILGADLWIPWGATPSTVPRNRRQFTVVARLAPGASLDDANAELATIAARTTTEFGGQFPEYEGWRVRAVTWTEAVAGQARGPAWLLLGSGLLVLLIACANLTSLMLTRLTSRRREVAVRFALGASGWQVSRLLFLESAFVATAATGVGLLAASVALGPVTAMLPVRLANLGQPEIDLRVMAYAGLIGLAAALITTAVPAWQARRAAPQATLREGLASTAGRQRLRQTLVVVELTLAVVLLVGASLLLRSYTRIQNIDPGFRTDHLLTMRLSLAWERFGNPGATQVFFREFVDRLNALPEVERAAAASQFPPEQPFSIPFFVEGSEASTTTLPTALVTLVTPGYFDVLGVPLRSGRTLTDSDREGAPLAVVVNEAFVDRFLGGQPGGRLLVSNDRLPADVVGVVANTRNNTLLRPADPEMFVTIDQGPSNNQLFLLLRTTTDPLSALPVVRRTLAEMDPDQPLYLIQTMEEALAGSVSTQRISLSLVGTFAVAALVIACVGVYGVVAYWVATRSREIGIRMALGASSRQVSRLVIRETLRLVLLGAALGLAGGVLIGRVAENQLYQTTSTDPLALVGVTMVLVLIGVTAGYVPARRALRVDPVNVLRAE